MTTTTTARKLHVGWIMPPFFHELPIDTDDPDEAARRLVDLTRTVLPEHPERQQMAFAMMHASQLDHFRSAGAVYAGFCLLDMEGRPSTASVCVYQFPTEGAPVEDTLTEIRSALERKYRNDDIQIMELPCGQALARIAAAPFLLPAEMSPTGTGVVVDRGLIHCYVPLPDTAEMLLFELSTPSMADWELYSELFAEIVRTLDWYTDEEFAEYTRLNQESRAQQPDQAQVQQVYARSSRVLDALAVRGRMDDEHSEVTATTCEHCWARGLRSPCTTAHRWRVEELDEHRLGPALERLATRLREEGWLPVGDAEAVVVERPGHETAPRVTARDQADGGHQVTVTAQPADRRLLVEVTALCARSAPAPADNPFG